ncbi:unnamed protein product, partial [Arctogadus glacialis]
GDSTEDGPRCTTNPGGQHCGWASVWDQPRGTALWMGLSVGPTQGDSTVDGPQCGTNPGGQHCGWASVWDQPRGTAL